MATNIDALIEEPDPINLERNPTLNIFGYTVDEFSLYTHIFSILTITLSTYFLNKYYKIFSNHRMTNFTYLFFLLVVIFNIIYSSTKTGDVTFEQAKLQAIKDQLLFIMGIMAITLLFFNNIQDYLSADKSIVMKIIVIAFIINLISIINISTVQKGAYVRIVRKVKESLYLLIIYLMSVAFVYGFFYKQKSN